MQFGLMRGEERNENTGKFNFNLHIHHCFVFVKIDYFIISIRMETKKTPIINML